MFVPSCEDFGGVRQAGGEGRERKKKKRPVDSLFPASSLSDYKSRLVMVE